MREVVYVGKSIMIVQERKGELVTVIQSSGYTCDEQAIKEPWLLTQFRTMPHLNRKKLPDPIILESQLPCYRDLDCTVYTVYFLPECEGIESAACELEHEVENLEIKTPQKLLIGHSKGGLLMTAVAKYLKYEMPIILIAPTFGTVWGDEKLVLEKLKGHYLREEGFLKKLELIPEIFLIKIALKFLLSRRAVDYDMVQDSEFLKKLNFSKLKNHYVLLISAECPEGYCSMKDSLVRHVGKMLSLYKEADGVVTLKNQEKPWDEVKKIVYLTATHASIFLQSNATVKNFIENLL